MICSRYYSFYLNTKRLAVFRFAGYIPSNQLFKFINFKTKQPFDVTTERLAELLMSRQLIPILIEGGKKDANT